jgi:anti-sigma factor ChrR (cupin superfamily)
MQLNADLKKNVIVRSHEIDWLQSPASGVDRRLLDRDECDQVERATTIVRFKAGSSFSPHTHPGGEEFIVLEGVFSDETGDYPAGSYVRNPPGSRHRPYSDPGCTIFVKLWQMAPDDQVPVRINTHDHSLWTRLNHGHASIPLHDSHYESVRLHRWKKGLEIPTQTFEDGVEYLVLEGGFTDEYGTHRQGGWLRLAPDSQQTITVQNDTLVYCKTGHLRNPIRYENLP